MKVDSTDTAQLLVFIRDIDDNLNAFKELVGLQVWKVEQLEKISEAKSLIVLLPNYILT